MGIPKGGIIRSAKLNPVSDNIFTAFQPKPLTFWRVANGCPMSNISPKYC